MVLVGEERHFGHVGEYARYLTDDADLVDHRLAGLHAGGFALVDKKLLREWIAP